MAKGSGPESQRTYKQAGGRRNYAEQAIFTSLSCTVSPGHFTPADLPLVSAHCEAACRARNPGDFTKWAQAREGEHIKCPEIERLASRGSLTT
jgi:hypothetical protein